MSFRESESTSERRSKSSAERSFDQRTIVRSSIFGRVCYAIWPNKPALHLSQKIPCTVRAAELWISGDRKPSGRALVVVMDEID